MSTFDGFDDIRALTIQQPWASLIAGGAKTIETRSWRTSYRGPVLIHAGARAASYAEAWAAWAATPADADDYTATRWPHRDISANPLPLGAVVAVADLIDCVPIVAPSSFVGHSIGRIYGLWEFVPGGPPWVDRDDQLPLGDFTPGRWAWLLDNVRPLAEPVPAKGRQGLWRPDADMAARCEAVAS